MLEELWIIFEKPIVWLLKAIRIICIIFLPISLLGIFIDYSARYTPRRVMLVLFLVATTFGLTKLVNILDGKEELHPKKEFELPAEVLKIRQDAEDARKAKEEYEKAHPAPKPDKPYIEMPDGSLYYFPDYEPPKEENNHDDK